MLVKAMTVVPFLGSFWCKFLESLIPIQPYAAELNLSILPHAKKGVTSACN